MLVNPSGNTTDSKFVQFLNEQTPILATDDGIITRVKSVHPRNESASISVRPSGRVQRPSIISNICIKVKFD